jgi:tetratricopeptide (TPR) repeat protein
MPVVWCGEVMKPIRIVSAAVLLSVCCSVPQIFCQDPLAQLLEQQRANPSDWKVLNQIAITYTQTQQFDKAAVFYRRVIRINPAFLPARKNLGVVLWFLNRKREAEVIFRKLLPEIPKDPVPHLYLALACHERSQYAAAKSHFSLAGDLAMKNPEVLPAAIDSYLATKDTSIVPAALEFMQREGATELYNAMASVFNRRGMYESTVTALTANKHPDTESDTLLAEALDKLGRPERAYATLANAIDRNPSDEKGYSALARFATAHDNNAYGLEVLEKGLQRNPRSPVLLVQRGLLVALAGDREQAARSFDAAAQANPGWAVPLLSRGVLELEAGDPDAAATTFRKAIAITPEDHNAYYFCALALSRNGDRGRPEAMDLLKKALAIAPEDAKSRVLLGQAHLAAGRVKEGIGELERALRSEPNNSTALYQLALAYRRLGNATLSQQRMAAFRRAKAKVAEEQTAILQVMKIVK